ncbi:polyhydroxyalkanoate biosynthesis repressor PhaR [Neobacillus drentensis]|uniref:polyhydroxyalkanoate biosynthesis repressor PhaR n=1 Tax=Neobacillus drentensis TaxID=220684 RepID=UPI0028570E59|nr:polyhydroxyalkanoate biosynthesis repressor PhaR [Neobacillus drentensis]MDR7236034.1 prefoldin subunit 5 [Neobacillus drentensis]
MSKDKIYDPFLGFRKISGMWEKRLNGLLFMMTDNNEFVRLLKVGTESHARYMELLRKNQELMAGVINIPTKKDVANVAKLSLQTEEKIDILEEQIWNLQDSLGSLNNENLAMFQEIVSIVQQMKDEFQKMAQEVAETQKLKEDFHELRQGLVDLSEIKQELATLKNLLQKGKTKDKEKELVLTGAGTKEERS